MQKFNGRLDRKTSKKLDEYYTEITSKNKKKGSLKLAIMLVCLYNLWIREGKLIFKEDLLDIFDVNNDDIKKAMKFFRDTGNSVETLSVIDIVKIYLSKFNVKEVEEDKLVKIQKAIEESSPLFKSAKDETMAALIVYYILFYNKLLIKKEFFEKIKISDITLNKYIKEIELKVDMKNLM